jgi:hypothetical protein
LAVTPDTRQSAARPHDKSKAAGPKHTSTSTITGAFIHRLIDISPTLTRSPVRPVLDAPNAGGTYCVVRVSGAGGPRDIVDPRRGVAAGLAGRSQMNSEPKAPNASAIFLYRQVDRDDFLATETIYARIR